MTSYQLIVLQMIADHDGELGWYQIERRLSTRVVDEREHLGEVLRAFEERAWIVATRVEVQPRYSITDKGLTELEEQRTRRSGR